VRLDVVAVPVNLATSQRFSEPTVEVFEIRIRGIEDVSQALQLRCLDLGPLRDFPF
jgi:hypothetical protein